MFNNISITTALQSFGEHHAHGQTLSNTTYEFTLHNATHSGITLLLKASQSSVGLFNRVAGCFLKIARLFHRDVSLSCSTLQIAESITECQHNPKRISMT